MMKVAVNKKLLKPLQLLKQILHLSQALSEIQNCLFLLKEEQLYFL